MNKGDIKIGKVYYVNGFHQSGTNKVEVTGPATKSKSYGSVYQFPVKFLDAPPNSRYAARKEGFVPSREFVREWTEQDQENLESRLADANHIAEVEAKLAEAGYSFVIVTILRGKLRLAFGDDDAEAVYKKLTEHVEQEVGSR